MKKTVLIIAAFAAALSLTSCLKDDTQDMSKFYANALVTVKHTPQGEFFLQLDDNTTAKTSNLSKSPYGDKQVRALANISDKGEYVPSAEGGADFDRLVEVNWIDSIRTKALELRGFATCFACFFGNPLEEMPSGGTMIIQSKTKAPVCCKPGAFVLGSFLTAPC